MTHKEMLDDRRQSVSELRAHTPAVLEDGAMGGAAFNDGALDGGNKERNAMAVGDATCDGSIASRDERPACRGSTEPQVGDPFGGAFTMYGGSVATQAARVEAFGELAQL